jgi:Holliday junction resolvasome RuvABC ATP-dependent DNA helicase subunit
MSKKDYFENVIGQDLAKASLTDSIRSGLKGGPMLSPLITGEAGNGKTHLAAAYCDAMEAEGVRVLRYVPRELRLGEGLDDILEAFQSGEKYVLWIDEMHELKGSTGAAATVTLNLIYNMIMRMLDGTNHGKIININSNTSIVFDPTKGSIVGTTNFPDRLDKSGAFQSRFDKLELDLYDEKELVDILKMMLSQKGFHHLNDKTLGMIARCGRGTGRPLEQIVKSLAIAHTASGKKQKTINAKEVLDALRRNRIYPKGLQEHEVEMMAYARDRTMQNRTFKSRMPKLETPTLCKSVGFLLSLDFFYDTGRGMETTDYGKRFLEAIVEDGFEVPEILTCAPATGPQY